MKERKFSRYSEVEAWLFKQLPMFQRVGEKALKVNLDNIRAISAATGDPHKHLKCIHVAGTNGKGTVSHLLTSVLLKHGYTVGTYTSPHYREYRERIRINGKLVKKTQVIDYINLLHKSPSVADIKMSFFELTVGMAFHVFAQNAVDFAVVEVGLGGRLDSTNIINPLLSVITNIGYDHQNLLGDTLTEIAGEKAGIIKPHIPIVIGEYQSEVFPVFEQKAKVESAPLFLARDLVLKTKKFKLSDLNLLKDTLETEYQKKNLMTALGGLIRLDLDKAIALDFDKVIAGVRDVRKLTGYLGRWQVLGKKPLVIAEAAHNIDGVKHLIRKLGELSYQKLHIVLGMVGDKPLDKVLALLPKDAKYYFVKANVPRGKQAELLQKEGQLYQLQGRVYTSVRKGLASAKMSAKSKDMILVTGSIFTVAEVV